MQIKLNRILLPFFFLTGLFLLTVQASANDAGFTVTAKIPENQADRSKTYFDLRMKPGQEQDLTLLIESTSDEDIIVNIETITASTNRNGIINYTSQPEYAEETRLYAFGELAAAPDEPIIVPARSVQEVVVSVAMPDTLFDGTVLGSIRIVKELGAEELQAGTSIVNRFSYVVGVRLRVTDIPVEPDFQLGPAGLTLVNYRAGVLVPVRNVKALITKGVSVVFHLFQEGGDGPVATYEKTGVEMAPNSVFPLSFVDEAGDGFPDGAYRVEGTLTYDGRTWTFGQDFRIGEEETAAVNSAAVNQGNPRGKQLGETDMPAWVWVCIPIGLVFIAVILFGITVLTRLYMDNRKYRVYLKEQKIHPGADIERPGHEG